VKRTLAFRLRNGLSLPGSYLTAAWLALVLAGFNLHTLQVAAQAAPTQPIGDFHIVCSLDHPVIDPLQSVVVNVYTDAPDPHALTYEWTSTDGDFSSPDQSSSTPWSKKVTTPRAVWSPRGLEPGSYKLSATVTSPSTPSILHPCSITVFVAHGTRGAQVTGAPSPAPSAGTHPGTALPGPPPQSPAAYGYATWRALLVRGQPQRPGFGLYSYMLLGGPPDGEAKERFLAFVKAYLDLIADVKGLESSQSPAALNITYLPVDSDPPENVDANWVLAHYDYSRARQILTSVHTARGRGPFIVSALKPLDGSFVIPTPNLIEDLTSKPAGVVEFWVNQFLVQTTQQQFWQSSSLRSVALSLRTAIAYAAEGYPIVQKAISASFIFNPSQ
jgi:hypothetical protein